MIKDVHKKPYEALDGKKYLQGLIAMVQDV